jgi:hypothetical protein
MTPAVYLEKYCKVTDRRKALYKRVFDKYKKKSDTGPDYVDIKVRNKFINESKTLLMIHIA